MNLAPLLVCLLPALQETPAPLDDRKIEAAIERGVKFLRHAPAPAGPEGLPDSDELLLWTLLHVGVPEDDVQVQTLLKKVLSAPLERTFNVALLAMCLEEIDRVRYQPSIGECAQFLVDNQCANGQWSAGAPTAFRLDLAPAPPPRPAPGRRALNLGPQPKPAVRRKVIVKQNQEGPGSGDAVHSLFAALGLRACFDAGMVLPADLPRKAEAHWLSGAAAETSPAGKDLRAWSSSVATTSAASASLAIWCYLQGRDWRKQKDIRAAVEWLGVHSRPVGPHFDLYCQERAGMLVGVEKFGGREWYPGAGRFLLDVQNPDGSWGTSEKAASSVRDTCFSLLVLHKRRSP